MENQTEFLKKKLDLKFKSIKYVTKLILQNHKHVIVNYIISKMKLISLWDF
jgi:hypothetical protein